MYGYTPKRENKCRLDVNVDEFGSAGALAHDESASTRGVCV